MILVGLLYLLLQQPRFQSWVVEKGIAYVENRLGTDLEVGEIDIDLFNKIALKQVYLEDKQGGTLLYADRIETSVRKLLWRESLLDIRTLEIDSIYLNLYRLENGDFNYQFVLDEFSSEDDKEETNEPSSLPDIRLDGLDIRNLRLDFMDGSEGLHVFADIPSIYLEVESMLLPSKELFLKELAIAYPEISLYKGAPSLVINASEQTEPEKPKDQTEKVDTIEEKSWLVKLDALFLEQAIIAYNDGPSQMVNDGSLNFKEILLEPLNVQVTNAVWAGDSLLASLDQFQFDEVSGFALDNVQAEIHYGQEGIYLRDLDVQTPHSKLQDQFGLQFKKWSDWSNFQKRVELDVVLKDSYIGLKDLEFFVPYFRQNDLSDRFRLIDKIELSGRIYDNYNNLYGKDIKLKAGQFTNFAGDFHLTSRPRWDSPLIDLEVSRLETHMDDLVVFLPDVSLPSNYRKLGNITFEGRYTGFWYDFVADGYVQTELGALRPNISMQLEGDATYSGELQLINFQMGEFLGDTERFGLVSLNAAVEGKGLNRDIIEANMDGTIEQFAFQGYSYENLKVDGVFSKNKFDGVLSSSDENFDLDFNGSFDLRSEVPVYSFNSTVRKLNLKELKLSEEDISLSFSGLVDFKGKTLDDFIGTGNLDDLTISKDGKEYELGKFDIASDLERQERSLVLESENVDANFEGEFRFADLVRGMGHFISKYFPNRFAADEANAGLLKDIKFSVDIKEPVQFGELFLKDLKEIGRGHLEGELDTESNYLDLQANLEGINFQGKQTDSLLLIAYTEKGFLHFDLSAEAFQYNEAVQVPEICIKADVKNGIMDLNASASQNESPNNLDLDALLYSKNDTFHLELKSLEATLANKNWKSEGGKIEFFDKENYSVEGIEFASEKGAVALSSLSLPDKRKNITQFEFDNFDLNELMGIIEKENLRVFGTLNGKGELTNIFDQPVITGDLKVDSAVIFSQHLGDVVASVVKRPGDSKLNIGGKVEGNDYEAFIGGTYDVGNKEEGIEPFLDLSVEVREFALAFMEGIIRGQISNTTGRANGDLRIYGSDLASPNIDGDLLLYGASTTIDFLQTHYSAATTKLRFDQHKIHLDDLVLYDKKLSGKEQNEAIANGYVDITDFGDVKVNVQIDSKNFLFLDTDRHDNDLFYGKVYAGGYVNLVGPLSDFNIDIFAKSNKGTGLKIPITDDTSVEEDRFFTFIKKGRELEDELEKEEEAISSNLSVNMKLELTTDAEIELIFDLQAGDIIRSRGHGEIEVGYSYDGLFDVFGNYTIDSGDYLFTMQNVVNKNFVLQPEGTIDFFGDPYEAIIDLSAIYTAKKTSLYQLMKDTEGTTSNNFDEMRKDLIDSEVILSLSGTLSAPEVDFQISIDEAASSIDNNARRRLTEINTDDDKNELNRQVFGLLVFNNYLPLNQFILDNEWTSEALQTTVSEFLSNQLTSLLSATLHEISPGSDISINWKNYTASDLDQAYDRNEIELVFSTRFLNDRVIVDVGGNFDVGENSEEIDNQVFLSDFVIQYKITDDGKYRIKVFTKTDRDILLGTSRRSGISLYVSEEFDDFRDLRKAFRERRTQRKERREKEEDL